jgi:glutamate decarboxylase
MTESFSKNFIDYEEYPRSAEIQNRCVNMIARLFNAPMEPTDEDHAIGTSCVGSSEAIMLGTLAMKKRWQNKRKAEGKDFSRPNIVMSSAVQVCWEKAARYFDIEEKFVYCTNERYVIDPEEAVDLVDENTIGICLILGTTYTGQYEDTKGINDLLVERGLDCPIHVDAASGGFVAPFVNPHLEWDFRLEKVVSINVSGHKYGLVCVKMTPISSFWLTVPHRFTPELDGSSGAPLSISRRNSCSTSTTLELNRPASRSISPRAHPRSLGSTTR